MFWNRLKARWRSHDDGLAERELRREAADAEALRDGLPPIVTPYLDQQTEPGAGLTHPQRDDTHPGD